MVAKVSREWQITLPEGIIRELAVGEGSLLECSVQEGEIRLRPASCSKKGGQNSVFTLARGGWRFSALEKCPSLCAESSLFSKAKRQRSYLPFCYAIRAGQ